MHTHQHQWQYLHYLNCDCIRFDYVLVLQGTDLFPERGYRGLLRLYQGTYAPLRLYYGAYATGLDLLSLNSPLLKFY
jgi:hypothetical protein